MAAGLAVSVDGEQLVTVAVDSLDMIDVRVHGDVVSDEFATLHVTGSRHPEGAESTFLIWIGDRVLHPGSEVEVTFVDSASTSFAGKTIDEFYPDEEQKPTNEWEPTDDMFDELAKRPRVRDRFRFEVLPSSDDPITAVTADQDHSFAFSVSWDSFHPERARVSLLSTTLQSIRDRVMGTYHAQWRMGLNERVMVRVDA